MLNQTNGFLPNSFRAFVALVVLYWPGGFSRGQEGTPSPAVAPALKEGHSQHGEVFNEGPRQAARLMEGVGRVRFPVTSASQDAQNFVAQGVAQLHGFWYFESERSFRQAAMLDPDCAIAYWGMAMSNRGNLNRAKGFIAEAMKRREKSGRREKLLIEAFDRWAGAKTEQESDRRQRANRYVSDLENILLEFPDDIETKAFLCEYFWSGKREGLEMASNLAVDSMIQQVLDADPLHPAHHYRIHLWDGRKPELALQSAALCGVSAPSIAHMWHMPGHIYSRLRRYHDAVWQQEASARVDHAQMMRDRLLPDQIHNFAHNNEWCIRNMTAIGRAEDAEALARNMLSLPRHPKYNDSGRGGSFRYGRERLLEVLEAFERWDRLASIIGTPGFEDSGTAEDDLQRDRATASALAMLGDPRVPAVRDRIQQQLTAEQTQRQQAVTEAETKAKEAKGDEKAIEKAKKDAEQKFASRISRLEKALHEIDGRVAAYAGDYGKAVELLGKADIPAEQLALLLMKAGKKDEAIKKIEERVKSRSGEVLPLAAQVEILAAADQQDAAKAAFESLRKLSSTIDLQVPPFQRLAPLASAWGFAADWRLPAELRADTGARPDLDSLGPFRWSPVMASSWTLPGVDGQPRSLGDYTGRPVVVVFYLGYGCLHCAEQLKAIAGNIQGFRDAGLEVIAISTDKQEHLRKALENLEGGLPFPLAADPGMAVFREYRCYDDFEKAALHGTFLVDAAGRVRWQDISYQPFMDTAFLLKEARRLLAIEPSAAPATTVPVQAAGVAAAK